MVIAGSKRRRLSIICVGTGRDGSLSVTDMIAEIYEQRGLGQTVDHEYCNREFYQAFSDYHESGEERYLHQIQRMIDECPFDCIVGNGYATILPMFYRAYSTNIALIHLRRGDRKTCVDSIAEDCTIFPTAYKYYTDAPSATVKRMAAFHFGDMPRSDWDSLSLESKCAWYYDKTHSLIDVAKPLFSRTVDLQTEALNEERTRQMLAWFVGGLNTRAPNPGHLNWNRIDIRSFPPERRAKMRWLLGRLNLHRLAHEDLYGLDYFAEKFIAWTVYQTRGHGTDMDLSDQRSKGQIAEIIDRAEALLERRLQDLRNMRQEL
jgi:hypothetical protein